MHNQAPLSWHPKFYPYQMVNGTLVLLSETQCFSLGGARFQTIINGVNGEASLDDLLRQAGDYTTAFQLRKTVEKLLKQQWLVAGKPDLSYTKPLAVLPHLEQGKQLYNLSSVDLAEYANLLPTSATIIFVDDYLQLSNEWLSTIKSPFLVVKLTGERLLVGPYLTLEPYTPCGQCLTHQILANQPVRKWVQTIENTDYMPLPVLCDDKLPPIEKIAPIVTQAINEPFTVLEVNRTNFSVQKHWVRHRLQCPTCCIPNWMKTEIQSPIVLQHTASKIANDGGSRASSAHHTVQSLQKLISPLTGVITNLMELPLPKASPIKIYRTAFFKSPSTHKSATQQDFVQISLGKGIDPVQSQASALCESIERYAAQYQGDEFWQKACPELLDARFYAPNQLVQFSERQYQHFSQNEQNIEKSKFATKPYKSTMALHWVPTWSVTYQERVYVPFNYGFANTPFEQDAQYIRWNSNGCAAGNTVEEAILQGLFELIERDATAIWWYNKVKTQAIDLNGLPQEHYQKFEQALQDWHYWGLNITNDLGIPVVAGIAQHKDTGKFCLGFGAHLNATIACQRALAELCQLIPIREQNGAPFDFDAIQPEAFLIPQGKLKALHSFAKQETSDIAEDVLYVVQKLKAQALETLVLNYSRPDLPIKTTKVIVPGLCHIWAQFGAQRLYKVPVAMGWANQLKKEEELNTHLLYI